MKLRSFIAALNAALLCILLAASPAGSGSMTLLGVGKVGAAGAAYVGPGDVVSGALVWYSPARAYNAAYATGSNPCMDLLDQGGLHPITINILSTGFVDKTAITNWVAANSVTTIQVTKLYDQTGNGVHVTEATFMPTLTLSALNGLPVLTMVAANNQRLISTATITASQPFSGSLVYNNTAANIGGILGTSASPDLFVLGPSANQLTLEAGLSPTVTASDATWHGVNANFNGLSTAANVSGVDTTGISGGTSAISATTIRIGRTSTGGAYDGKWAEGGIWSTGFTAPQRASMYSNQNGANGYNGAV